LFIAGINHLPEEAGFAGWPSIRWRPRHAGDYIGGTNADVRLCVLEAANRRELESHVAGLVAQGWREIDGRLIAAPSHDAPFWVQVLYWAPAPLPVEVVRINPTSFQHRDRPQSGKTET
jgi:hypothetical protein